MGTPLKDEHFDIVSVLYHALQGASTCDTYIQDAKEGGDNELTEFFSEAKEHYQKVAERAKQIAKLKLASA